MIPDLHRLLLDVTALAREAGHAILGVYASSFSVTEKDDRSPLTEADLESERLILAGLRRLAPEIPVLSEESGRAPYAKRAAWDWLWVVDPLDGTKEFVNRNGEFTVNVALIENGRPVFGVVHVPVSGKTYVGCNGYGADVRMPGRPPRSISVSASSAVPARVVGSRSHRGSSLDNFLDSLGEYEMHPMGSSLKFCVIAEGLADVYPRLGPTSEWDTAAAQAVVEQAGGKVVTLDGKPLMYNTKSDILNPHFLVVGPQDNDWLGMLVAS